MTVGGVKPVATIAFLGLKRARQSYRQNGVPTLITTEGQQCRESDYAIMIGPQQVPSFGQTIRALRMGFYWLHRHGCFLRISGGHGDVPFRADVYPCGRIPNHERRTDEVHRVWWKTTSSETCLDVDEITAIRWLKRAKRPFSFYFNEEGITI